MMSELEKGAAQFAARAHEGQKRKYTGEPYLTHCAEVVEAVRSVPHTEEMLAAAWLHDVVEDCAVTLEEVHQLFGAEVAMMVSDLTDVSKPGDGNRAQRKAIDRAHSAVALPESKTIKLADLISNTESIVARDPSFARVYLAEKIKLLDLLRDGDQTLWAKAHRIALEGMASINR